MYDQDYCVAPHGLRVRRFPEHFSSWAWLWVSTATQPSPYRCPLCCRAIYDTLVNSTHPDSLIPVPGIALGAKCGEVPQADWTWNLTPVSEGVNLTVVASLNQRTLGRCTAWKT